MQFQRSLGCSKSDKMFWYSEERFAFGVLQIALALVTTGSSLYLATKKSGDQSKIYLTAGLGMAAMLPYTIIWIFPTNHRLMSADKKEDTEV